MQGLSNQQVHWGTENQGGVSPVPGGTEQPLCRLGVHILLYDFLLCHLSLSLSLPLPFPPDTATPQRPTCLAHPSHQKMKVLFATSEHGPCRSDAGDTLPFINACADSATPVEGETPFRRGRWSVRLRLTSHSADVGASGLRMEVREAPWL